MTDSIILMKYKNKRSKVLLNDKYNIIIKCLLNKLLFKY